MSELERDEFLEKEFDFCKAIKNPYAKMLLNEVHSPSLDDIEEVEPDEIDIQMLKEIEADPECLEFEKDGDIVWT